MLGLTAAALAAAPPAAAHVTLLPAAVETASTTTLRVEVPSLPSGEGAVGVELEADGLEQLDVVERPPIGTEAQFDVRVRIDAGPGPLRVDLRILYPGAAVVVAPQTLTVTPAATGGAGRWPLVATVALGALVLAALGVIHRRTRR